MNANIQTITLDLTNSAFSAAQKVSVVQGDSGTRPVKAIITDNGVVRTDLSHNSARIYISNVPGEPPTYVEGILIINGVAEFCIPQSATLQPGIKNGELRLVGENEKVLSSMSFMVDVNPSQYDEKALLGTDKGDVLERMIEETSENKFAAAESAEAARISAEAADDAAKAAAESAAAAENAATLGVSYSEEQNLTSEQKETARNNINAVDASLVVSSLSDDSQIPNGAGIRNAIEEFTLHECVRYDVKQPIIDEYKRIARDNIDAAKKTGDWEKLYEITTDGVTKKWEISTFADGDALVLTSLGVKIVAKNPVSETPVSAHLTLRGMYVENGSALLTVMVPLVNIVSTTENLVAVCTMNNDRGVWFTKFCEAVPNTAGKVSAESYIPSNMFTYDGVQYPILNAVTLSGNGTLAAGNTIEIWGVRK